MKYTIISRDEFLKLIKFGTIYQNINYIVEEKNQQKVISEILKALPYDDPFGYVVVEFTYEENFSISYMQTLVKLDIKDIINIYCLTNEALDFYKTKFNPNIKFKLFENQDLIKEVNFHKLIEDKKQGIEVLFEIFKLNLKDVNEKYNDNLIKELLEFKENNYLEQEYKNFYFDLFCYERKNNNFFKEDIGFIADIRAISKMQDIRKNKEVFLTGDYSNLSSEKDRENLQFTLKTLIIDSIEKVKKSDKKTDEEKNEIIRNLVVAAIFLKSQKLLNTESGELNYWENFINLINEFKEDFLEEIKEALWYLGVFLGYKYLYDDYYNFLDLIIFKEDICSIDSLTNEENEVNKLKQENEQLKKQLEIKTQQIEQHIQITSNINNDNLKISELSNQLDEKSKKEEELNNKIEKLNQKMEEDPIKSNNNLINEEQESKLVKLQQENEELSKRIIDLENSAKVNSSSQNTPNINNSNQTNLSVPIKEEIQKQTEADKFDKSLFLDMNSLNKMNYETLIDIAHIKRIEKTKKDLKSKYSKSDEGKNSLASVIINNKNLINQ